MSVIRKFPAVGWGGVVGKMGFQTGNILEPSCGVGNFFGMLPEEMRGSKLYGVELDSITGRIALRGQRCVEFRKLLGPGGLALVKSV